MKTFTSSFHIPHKIEQFLPFITYLISLLSALLGGILLFSSAGISSLTFTIIDIGLDPQRAQLIAALVMTAGAALIGTIIGRRKLGAVIGAAIVFWFGYLANFISLELLPAHDPGGNLEPLDSSALFHTSILMVALALLFAFIGSAVGLALGQVVLDPPYQLAQSLWQYFRRKYKASLPVYEKPTQELLLSPHSSERPLIIAPFLKQRLSGDTPVPATKDEVVYNYSPISKEMQAYPVPHPSPQSIIDLIASWLGALIMLILIVVASGAGELFFFSPDVGLHTRPNLPQKVVAMHSVILQDSIVSPALGGQRKGFLVYLPPSYNTPQGRARRYPTLYLLHGVPGGWYDMFRGGKANTAADTLIALDKIPELIMILPDGNPLPAGLGSEWGNNLKTHQFFENYVAYDLVKYVDSKYRTIPRAPDRAIGGISMGGFGAMNIAVHHPDIFGSVISLGGYYYAEGSVWGNNAAYMRENSPADVLPTNTQAWKLHIFLGAATKDEPYYTYTKQFTQELDSLHIPYHLDIQKGYHSWTIWQVQTYYALLWLRWG